MTHNTAGQAWRAARNAHIIELHAAGVPIADIAARYGLGAKYTSVIARGKLAERRLREKVRAALRAPPEPVHRIKIKDIVAHAAQIFDTTEDNIVGQRRFKHMLPPRYAACYVAREVAGHSYPTIGIWLGERDHSTVMSARRRCVEMMQRSEEYRAQVLRLVEAVNGGVAPLQIVAPEPAPEPDPEPQPLPEPITVNDGPKWWELSDDELIAQRIAEYRRAGGDFVEVY